MTAWPIPDAIVATAALLAGALVGLAYFAALRQTVRILAGTGGWVIPSALTLARIASIALLLAAAAHWGAVELLLAFVGFLMARTLCIGRLSRSL